MVLTCLSDSARGIPNHQRQEHDQILDHNNSIANAISQAGHYSTVATDLISYSRQTRVLPSCLVGRPCTLPRKTQPAHTAAKRDPRPYSPPCSTKQRRSGLSVADFPSNPSGPMAIRLSPYQDPKKNYPPRRQGFICSGGGTGRCGVCCNFCVLHPCMSDAPTCRLPAHRTGLAMVRGVGIGLSVRQMGPEHSL